MNIAGSTTECTLSGAHREELRANTGSGSGRGEAADVRDETVEVQ